MILVLKLVTGEDVLAEVEDKESHYVLKNPVVIGLTQEGVGTMPLCPFSQDKETIIEKHHVVFTNTPEEECRNAYSANYGSGIVVATEADVSGLRVIGGEVQE